MAIALHSPKALQRTVGFGILASAWTSTVYPKKIQYSPVQVVQRRKRCSDFSWIPEQDLCSTIFWQDCKIWLQSWVGMTQGGPQKGPISRQKQSRFLQRDTVAGRNPAPPWMVETCWNPRMIYKGINHDKTIYHLVQDFFHIAETWGHSQGCTGPCQTHWPGATALRGRGCAAHASRPTRPTPRAACAGLRGGGAQVVVPIDWWFYSIFQWMIWGISGGCMGLYIV